MKKQLFFLALFFSALQMHASDNNDDNLISSAQACSSSQATPQNTDLITALMQHERVFTDSDLLNPLERFNAILDENEKNTFIKVILRLSKKDKLIERKSIVKSYQLTLNNNNNNTTDFNPENVATIRQAK